MSDQTQAKSVPGALLPHDWPKNYPFTCIQDYVVKGSVQMQKGAKGYVVNLHSQDPNWLLLGLPYAKDQYTVWVRRKFIEIGTRKWGDTRIDIAISPMRLEASKYTGGSGTFFYKVIWTLLDQMRQYQDEIPGLPGWFKKHLSNPADVRSIATDVVSHTVKPIRDLFERQNFTVAEFVAALPRIPKDRETSGVYSRLYKEEDALTKAVLWMALYSGHSIHMSERESEHDMAMRTNVVNQHYKVVKQATTRVSGVVMFVDKNKKQLMVIGEQVYVLLFNSYNRLLTGSANHPTTDKPEPEGKALMATIAKHFDDFESAKVLTKIADNAAKLSGWKVSQEDGGWNMARGCNWRSPITESQAGEKLIFIHSVIPERNIELFERPECKVVKGATFGGANQNAGKVVLLRTESKGVSEFKINIDFSQIPLSTPVLPMFEMTLDGSIHPENYARLPGQKFWSDHDLACSWALRLEWQINGQWKSMYVRRVRVWEMADTKEPGSFEGYSKGLAVYRFLKQLHKPTDLPKWHFDFRVATLKARTFDHMTQTWHLKDVNPPFQRAPLGIKKTMQEIEGDMRAIGLNVAKWQKFDGLGSKKRKACDSCLKREKGGNCRQDPNNRDICTECVKIGRPCTWTRAVERCPKNDRRIAFLLPSPLSAVIRDIPDPDLQYIGGSSGDTTDGMS